jgi:uncharacterized protein
MSFATLVPRVARDPRLLRWFVVAVTWLAAIPGNSQAQSFDCGKAHDAVDLAICASPRLSQLDSDLAKAYAAALARDPTQAGAARQAQRDWIRSRIACLSAKPAAQADACLAVSYAARLAALTPRQPITATAPVPTAPATSVFAAPRQATGLPETSTAAATLDRGQFPTAGETDTLLHVTTPGHFALRAQSPTGTALQLVDMLTGPGDRAGWPGKANGRIDALLEVGTYKLRAFGDPAATGDTTLSATGFAPSGPDQLAPGYQPAATALEDLQFQSWWLVVTDPAATTRIEAAGRSLAALKVWRDGRDLVALPEQTGGIAATPAHPLTDIVLSGLLPPGTYRVTAYGGPPLPWADGATDQPLYLRTGYSTDLLTGGAAGTVGLFGTQVFRLPPNAAQVLLTVPQPTAAHLTATVAGADAASIDLTRENRARTALLDIQGKPGQERVVALQASPGQAFTLRPLERAGVRPDRPGHFLLAAAEPANGGDDVPAAAILTRMRPDNTGDVIATPGVPDIGPNKAWRTRFNLRGATTLLFHVTAPVTVAVHGDGPPITSRIVTLENAVLNAQGDGRTATTWALSPGWYGLALTVKPDAIGILDLTLGPPGLIPPTPEPAGPAAPILPLGEQSFDPQTRIALHVNQGPDIPARMLIRALPVELTDGPLVQTLAAGEARRIDVHANTAGTLMVRDIAGAALLESRTVDANTTTTVALPAADHARTLAIALLPPPPTDTPAPAPAPNLTSMQTGQPVFLDLARDATATFGLTVTDGGLYRVETLGRLKTAGRIGTAFIPELDQASANGIGNNMLLQRYLRAGRYRVEVTAQASAGRLGVSIAAAPLDQGADLLSGFSVRATLPPSHAIAFPIRITKAGRYHLDLLGDGREFTARLEDADGWPLLASGKLSAVDQDLSPGRYRLIVQPESVQARAVARLRRTETPPPLTGHGPHALPFDAPQSLEWREPPGRDDRRTPDRWTFALSGPAKVTLQLDGDGMSAVLQNDAAPPDARPLGRVLAGTPTTFDLPAGHYYAAATALGRNDRLTYTIALHSAELQSDTPRNVALPADLTFAIAAPRVVTLTSFGDAKLSAELRDDAGNVLSRTIGRTDDWNLALSRLLPAGRYHLALAPLVAPAGRATADDSAQTPSDDSQDAASNADSTTGDTDQSGSGQDSQDQGMATPDSADTSPDQTNSDDSSPAKPAPRTEVTLFLPKDQPDLPLPADGALVLNAGGIQHVILPASPAKSLLVAAAEAPVELILTLEKKHADGAWQVVGQSQGLAPILGVPVGDTAATWRASIWTVDGGTLPVRFAARAVTAAPAPIGSVQLAPVTLDGITAHWHAAQLADPNAAILRVTGVDARMLAATTPDQPATAPAGGTIVAQSVTVWLLSPNPAPPTLTAEQAGPNTALAISVPAGGKATLPIPSSAALCGFIVESGLGQPGVQAGRGMGVAPGSAFGLCGGATLDVWNAGADNALRLRLRRQDLTEQPPVAMDAVFAGTLPPHAAVPLRLPAGLKRLDVSLPGGGALVAGWRQPDAITAWAGDLPLTRSLTGDWTEALLVNTGDSPAPAALTATATTQHASLAPGGMVRRFFGAAGSFVLPLTAQAGQRLVVTGPAAASVQRPDGKVRAGTTIPLDGLATAVVTHRAGPLALWIEGLNVSPWPATTPRDVTLPQHLTLASEAMALRLSPGAPVLLRLTTTAPVILALGTEPPTLFDKGAELARYLPAGETMLRLLSPQDGPLSGSLDLSGRPVTETAEGLGAAVAIAPGGAAVFGFTVTAAGPVGLGVRADPDRVAVRLLDEHGVTLQRGVSMLRQLTPGHYLLEASVPPDAPTTLARPAVLGTAPHPNPPPPDIVRGLLIAAGFAPPDSAR